MAIVLNDVVTPNNTSVVNANFQKIEDAINDDMLKREVEQGEANEMRTILDMNGNKQVNLTDGVDPQDAATVKQMGDNLALTTAQRVLAEDAATSADADATVATTQANTATAQAVISTDQAVISTAEAVASAQSAVDAQAIADGLPTVFIETVVAGTDITVDATDPNNPIISSTATGGQVDTIVAGTNVTIDATDPVNPIVNATGGGASPLTTKGDVFVYDTGDQRLSVGTDGQVLTADSTEATGLAWADGSGGVSGVLFETTIATATDVVDITLPAGTKDIKLLIAAVNDGVTATLQLYHNDASGLIDNTSSNYGTQFTQALSTSLTAGVITDSFLVVIGTGLSAKVDATLSVGPDKAIAYVLSTRETSSSPAEIRCATVIHTGTNPTELVKLQLTASAVDAFGVGTRIQVIDESIAAVVQTEEVYSATETVIGTWLGATLYRKVIDFGTLPNATTKNVAHGITSPFIKSIGGHATNVTNFTLTIPALNTDENFSIQFTADQTNVTAVSTEDRTAYINCHIVLEYTK